MRCDVCKKESATVKICSRCKILRYCSKDCQRWKALGVESGRNDIWFITDNESVNGFFGECFTITPFTQNWLDKKWSSRTMLQSIGWRFGVHHSFRQIYSWRCHAEDVAPRTDGQGRSLLHGHVTMSPCRWKDAPDPKVHGRSENPSMRMILCFEVETFTYKYT